MLTVTPDRDGRAREHLDARGAVPRRCQRLLAVLQAGPARGETDAGQLEEHLERQIAVVGTPLQGIGGRVQVPGRPRTLGARIQDGAGPVGSMDPRTAHGNQGGVGVGRYRAGGAAACHWRDAGRRRVEHDGQMMGYGSGETGRQWGYNRCLGGVMGRLLVFDCIFPKQDVRIHHHHNVKFMYIYNLIAIYLSNPPPFISL